MDPYVLVLDEDGFLKKECNRLRLNYRETIVVNVLKYCKSEAATKNLIKPIEDPESRTSSATKVPQDELSLMYDRHQIAKTRGGNSSIRMQLLVLNSLCSFYERKQLPSFTEMFKELKESLPTFKNILMLFKYELTMLGIDYRGMYDQYVLVENPLITFERSSYVKEILYMRHTGYNVYYINERIIDRNQMYYNLSKKKAQEYETAEDEYIFFHAISKRGFANGLFIKSPTEDDFFKWVQDHLLSCIQPSSVILLDNSPLHGIKTLKQITIYDTKEEMQQWLQDQDIPWTQEMNKAQLYELVRNNPMFEKPSRVESLIKEHGHKVLRMPTHMGTLTPLELIWIIIKRTPIPFDIIQDEIVSKFNNIDVDEYRAHDKIIEKIENYIVSLDKRMEKSFNDFLLELERRKLAKKGNLSKDNLLNFDNNN